MTCESYEEFSKKCNESYQRTIEVAIYLELCEKLLKDILAVTHRDGGQYTAEHGIDKSARDAMHIISGLVVK